jgi:hypothetical protein
MQQTHHRKFDSTGDAVMLTEWRIRTLFTAW